MCGADQMMHLNGQTLPRFGRPVVADSTHMCVAEYVSSKLRPTFKGYKGFADQVLLRAYTCVAQKSGLHPGVEILSRPHTHVRCRLGYLRVAPKGQGLQGLQGFARPLAAASFTQGSTATQRFGRPPAAAGTHRCVAEVAPRIQRCTHGSRSATARTHAVRAHVLQNRSIKRCTRGTRVTQVTRFGRPVAALSIHTCVAECVNSGVHPGAKGYNGVANQLLL